MHKFVVMDRFKGAIYSRRGFTTLLTTSIVLAAVYPALQVPIVESGVLSAAKPGASLEGKACLYPGKKTTSYGVQLICKKGKNTSSRWVRYVKIPETKELLEVEKEITAYIIPQIVEISAPTATKAEQKIISNQKKWDESTALDVLLAQFSNRLGQSAKNQPEMIFEFGRDADPEYKELITIGINAGAKFWSADIKSPLKFPVIYSGSDDKDWFLSRIAFYGHSSPIYLAEVERRIGMEGNNVMLAGLSYAHGTYLMQYLKGSGRTTLYPLDYSTASHEYSHAAQNYFLKGNVNAFPCWAMEGGANVYANIIVGLFIRNTKADEYLIRNGSVRMSLESKQYELWAANNEQIYDMIKTIEPQNSPQCTFPGKLGYSLGMLMYEQLLAKYGQAKAIEWMESSSTYGWQTAFESVYGIKVDDWYKIEAIPYVKDEIKKIKMQWPRE